MAMNPLGYDNEKMKAVNFFITNGWPEGTAYELVEAFTKKSLNPGEIIVLGSLMKTLNTIYRRAAKDDTNKLPKISIVSDYPLFKVALNDVSPLMGRMMIIEGGKIYVEIDITEGELFHAVDWIEFAETNEQLEAYDKFLNDLLEGKSEYLKLADGTPYRLEDITYDNINEYIGRFATLDGKIHPNE